MKFAAGSKNIYIVAVLCVIASALFNAFQTPISKLLLTDVSPGMTAVFLNLGSGLGILLLALAGRKTTLIEKDRHIRKSDIPCLIGVIAGYTAGNILIMFGLTMTSAAEGTVLSNFKTVATALLALFLFREVIGKRLWIGIIFITLGCIALSCGDITSFSFNPGSIMILLGCVGYGFAYNFNKLLSKRNPAEVVIVKSFGVALCSLIFALILGESFPAVQNIPALLIAGVFTFGFVTLLLIYGQRHLGAAKAGAIYGISPIIGVVVSCILFQELPTVGFLAALLLAIPGLYFAVTKNREDDSNDDEYVNADTGDSPFFADMPVSSKDEVRNYVTSFGLMLIATLYILVLFGINDYMSGALTQDAAFSNMTYPAVILSILLMLCGIVLLVLRNRVLSAVTFLFMSAEFLLYALEHESYFVVPFASVFSLILAAIILTCRSPKKYLYAVINILCGLIGVLGLFDSGTPLGTAAVVCMIVTSGILIYFAVACASQKIEMPFTKFLTNDDDMAFSQSGPVLGYLFLGLYLFMWVLYNFIGEENFPPEIISAVCFAVSLMIMVIGFLSFAVGRMRFTPLFFLATGAAFLIDLYVSGSMHYVVAMLLLLIGILAVFRKHSRLMPSLLVIGFGFARFLMNNVEAFPELITVVSILNIACMLLAVYLAFAVFAEKPKLPLF